MDTPLVIHTALFVSAPSDGRIGKLIRTGPLIDRSCVPIHTARFDIAAAPLSEREANLTRSRSGSGRAFTC